MIDIIGEFGLNAGKVWNILNSCGSLTEDELIEKTGLGMEKIHIAVGWLARENKIFNDGELFKIGETNLAVKIGENASQLSKAIGTEEVDIFNISGLPQMEEKDIFSALGWLAREGKINSNVEKRTDELRSVDLEIESMKGELKSLNEDLETRNHIIKEMTSQLSERQTQFVENIGIVERLQIELEENESGMKKRTDELRSVDLEIESMKGELKSLNEDLETRNHIIKEMTSQLSERQTQFVENIGIVERLQIELEENENKMEEMKEEINKRESDISQLQRDLGNDFINPKITTSTLLNENHPLTSSLKKQQQNEFELRENDELDTFHDVAGARKIKTLGENESEDI